MGLFLDLTSKNNILSVKTMKLYCKIVKKNKKFDNFKYHKTVVKKV
jgi:hypothetical protein